MRRTLMSRLSLPLQGFSFRSAASLYRSHNSSSVSRARQGAESRPQLMKSSSVSAGWQPWMPIPPSETCAADADDEDSAFSSVHTQPSLSSSSTSSSTSSSSNSLSAPCPSAPPASSGGSLGILAASGDAACGRRRHRSQPQPPSGGSFPFNLDDESIRTSDV